MTTRVAVWSQVLAPGERVRVHPLSDFHLTGATFGEDVKEDGGRAVIKLYRVAIPDDEDEEDEDEDEDEDEEKELTFEKEPVIIGHLVPGRVETQMLNLVFTDDEPIELEVSGKNAVQLYGNYIDQPPPVGAFDDDEDDLEDDEDEEAYPLGEVSSDVEIDPEEAAALGLGYSDSDDEEEDHSRIEEVDEETAPKKDKSGKKRPRESDGMEVDGGKEKKDKKKLKNENGAAVAAPAKEDAKASKKDKKDKKSKDEKPKDEKPSGDEKKGGNVRKTKSGVTVDVRTEGKGPAAKPGNHLSMRYIGKLEDGTRFDANTSGKPFTFTLGKGEVIKGWDEGLEGLQRGTEAILTIPPQLAYGKKGTDGIPPNSTLKFEVKILNIK